MGGLRVESNSWAQYVGGREGLGPALLLKGMRSLREAGISTAMLGVDAESPTGANRLYESVGFKVRSLEVACKRPLEQISI